VWLEVKKPLGVSADVPLKDEAPIEIRSKYGSTRRSDLVVWLDDETNTIGFIKNNRSISNSLESASAIVLGYMKPAKGPGFIELMFTDNLGKNVVAIFSQSWTQKDFDWLKSIQSTIASATNFESRELCYGFDA